MVLGGKASALVDKSLEGAEPAAVGNFLQFVAAAGGADVEQVGIYSLVGAGQAGIVGESRLDRARGGE